MLSRSRAWRSLTLSSGLPSGIWSSAVDVPTETEPGSKRQSRAVKDAQVVPSSTGKAAEMKRRPSIGRSFVPLWPPPTCTPTEVSSTVRLRPPRVLLALPVSYVIGARQATGWPGGRVSTSQGTGTDYADSLGSMGDAENLRQVIRQQIDTGALPCGHQRMWAGPGREHVCIVCGAAIPPTMNEYEVLFPGSDESMNSLYFHLGCLNAWLEECRERDGRD
jgi:hypothetical protein